LDSQIFPSALHVINDDALANDAKILTQGSKTVLRDAVTLGSPEYCQCRCVSFSELSLSSPSATSHIAQLCREPKYTPQTNEPSIEKQALIRRDPSGRWASLCGLVLTRLDFVEYNLSSHLRKTI